ncbi:MAG: hypothetical protein ACQETD_10125 [Pseudomonadota bacterium]
MSRFDLRDMRSLIGRPVVHQGVACVVVELLETEPALVLEASGPRQEIQDNQYGDPQRRVSEVFTIPFFEEGGSGSPHPDLLALELELLSE